ncbi:MAG: RNA-directed DNA polymerase [Planctomycetes bacterium]|nr:RNA-directed DNA polymerase [Planctomycetota bacterium]
MSDFIALEGQRFDINLMLKHLKYDLKDDWFQDSLNYNDALCRDTVEDYFSNYTRSASIKYDFCESEQYNIPKQGFTLRYSLETNIYDRLVYQALAGYLIQFYDGILNPCVYGHRWCAKPNGRYIFKNHIDAWKSFVGEVTEEFNSSSNNVLLVTDIMNFFENIEHVQVSASFDNNLSKIVASRAEKKNIKSCCRLIVRGLKKWAGSSASGIPQNRDASSFIANILLHVVDDAMYKNNYKYFRYMDDIRIVCKDKFAARKALKELIISLRAIGLNVNAKKTFILTSDDMNIKEYLWNPNRLIEQIDQMWKSKRLSNISKSLPLLRRLTLKCIRGNETQDREFRFCIHRLEQIALCNETRRIFNFDGITDAIIDELVNQPFSSDKLVRYLKSVELSQKHLDSIAELLSDDSKNIYGWQSYLLWQLLVTHRRDDSDLRKLAIRNIKQKAKDPDIAGSALYLGACGAGKDRVFVAKNFSSFSSHLIQRNALIAVHELPYNQYIKPYVQDYVRDDLKGTYTRLIKKSKGIYFVSPDLVKASDLYRELQEYDR